MPEYDSRQVPVGRHLSACLQGTIAKVCAGGAFGRRGHGRYQVRAVREEVLEEEVQSMLGRQ